MARRFMPIQKATMTNSRNEGCPPFFVPSTGKQSGAVRNQDYIDVAPPTFWT